LQRWRVIGNVWEILLSRDLNPILPAFEANVVLLAPSLQLRMLIFLKKKCKNRSVPSVEHRSLLGVAILHIYSVSLVELDQKT